MIFLKTTKKFLKIFYCLQRSLKRSKRNSLFYLKKFSLVYISQDAIDHYIQFIIVSVQYGRQVVASLKLVQICFRKKSI